MVGDVRDERRTGNTGELSPPARRRLARVALCCAILAVLVLLLSALQRNGPLLLFALLGTVAFVAAAYWCVAHRGPVRWLAVLSLVAVPVALCWALAVSGSVLQALAVAVLAALALLAGHAALRLPSTGMPEYDVPPPRRPFVVMNPRSGGGKVRRFGLAERARALGAEVVVLDGFGGEDVVTLCEDAVARGADLLGAAGGDGTQALVASVAVRHGLPFMVVSAGTRNHFALDLGLDRDDPSRCLAALTDDAVELHVDIGEVDCRPFVNNASFGAYAAIVQSPVYREDKARTTLDMLPDLLAGHSGARLTVQADGLTVEGPQAVLVSVDPYGMGDIAGLGRRARLDAGTLGVVVIDVASARQAVGLLRRTTRRGVTSVTVPEVVVDADAAQIPVGVDGEALLLRPPVTCSVRPRALRVRVPRDRIGVRAPTAAWSWSRLWALATSSSSGTEVR